MLNPEIFAIKSKEISGTADAFGLLPVARRIAALSNSEIIPVHWREIDRFYEIKFAGESVKIGGIFVPKHRDSKLTALRAMLTDIQEMDPVEIKPNGIVISRGVRISPHDLRLAFLTEDLRMGEQIVASVYEFWRQKIVKV